MSYSYNPKDTLEYTIADGENGEDIHTLKWSIPNFLYIINCNYIKTYETEYFSDIETEYFSDIGSLFKLKIKICGENNDLFEIYYNNTKNVVLHYATCMLLDVLHNNGYGRIKERIWDGSFHTVAAKKWQHLFTLNKQKVNTYCSKSVDKIFKTEFIFRASSIVSEPVELGPAEHQLGNNLEKFLKSSMLSDVTLISAQGFKFKVHKLILSSRSTVLKAHFEHDTIENQTNTIESHVDTEVLKEVLTYIYTDEVPKLQEMAEKILAAAEFYNLPGLKDICAEMLYLKLTKDNVIETIQLSDLHSASYLTKLTLTFIKDGNWAFIITESNSWKSLNSINIIKILYEGIAKFIHDPMRHK